jgi:hypothetical protein
MSLYIDLSSVAIIYINKFCMIIKVIKRVFFVFFRNPGIVPSLSTRISLSEA